MDQQKWHTKIILKRFGLVLGLFFIEQLFFFLSPSIKLSAMFFSEQQIKDMTKAAPLLFDPTFVASLKIGLTITLMAILIAFTRNIIMKQDHVLRIDTTQRLRDIEPKKRPKLPAFVIILLGAGTIFSLNLIANVVRLLTTHTTTSANQQTLNNMATEVSSAIWLFIFGALLIPIFEELIFRRMLIDFVGPASLRRQFIVFSVFLFAILHMLASQNVLADAIAYGGPAIVLSYLYVKFGNIRYGIYSHMIINIIAFSPLLVIIFNHLAQNANHYFDILTSGAMPGK